MLTNVTCSNKCLINATHNFYLIFLGLFFFRSFWTLFPKFNILFFKKYCNACTVLLYKLKNPTQYEKFVAKIIMRKYTYFVVMNNSIIKVMIKKTSNVNS